LNAVTLGGWRGFGHGLSLVAKGMMRNITWVNLKHITWVKLETGKETSLGTRTVCSVLVSE
jgi:hypothetical protein